MAASIESTPSLTPSPSRSPSPNSLVQPDHFYSPDGNVHPAPPSPESSGRAWFSPDDDLLAARGIPVFKPTMEEFRDFEAYMNRVELWGRRSGIVKIVPPKEWTDSLPSTIPQLANVRINSPIEQHMLGHAGIFRQQNIVRRKAVSIREWAELCAKEDYRAPAVDEVGLKAAGEHTPHVKRKNKRRGTTAAKENEPLVKEEIEEEARLEGSATMHGVATPPPVAEVDSDAEFGGDEHAASSRISPSRGPSTSPRKRHFPTREEREAAAARRAELDAAFLETFDPHTAWLPRNTSASDYTPSFRSTLERRYWRNCGIGKPAWYGADTPGTLFTDETTVWNVGSLPSTLSRLLPKNKSGLPGVNTPYLYFGMWRATFAWHVEDMDLFSINYIHWGAPKFWYAVPQMRAMQLENTLRSLFPRDGEKCRQFLRHKSFFASPTLLAQSDCKPNTLVQHAGEFVITYPRGYHAGFNLGFNCAESVNFALDSWLDIGRKAQACGCVGDSVRIDVDALLRAREEEELVVEEEVQPPSKPSSKKPSSKGEDPKKTKSPKKRKSNGSNDTRAKKRKGNPETAEMEVTANGAPSSSSASGSKQTIMLRLPKDPGPYPCCLCVSRNADGLLRVHDCPNPWSGCENVPPKDASGNEVWRAHESCAMVVPETWVDEEENEEGQVEKVVFGVDTIVKDRWALKCSLCQKSRARAHGAPIQCTKGMCTKAFHVSCAREGGQENWIQFSELREVEKEVVLNDPLPSAESLRLAEPSEEANVILESIGSGDNASIDPSLLSIPPPSVPLPDGSAPSHDQALPSSNVVKTIKKVSYELLCTQHNPVVIAARRASKVDRVRNELLSLPAMSRIKLRVSAGVFEVSLLSVNEERNTVEVIWDNGIRKEFKWGSLVWGKTEGQTVGQKPTVPAPPKEPVSEQTQPYLNVPFGPPGHAALSRSATPSTSTQPSIPATTSTHYPYTYFTGGNFNYNAWWNAFYAYAPPMSTNPTASSSSGNVQTYPQYSDAAAYQPPMASLTWAAPTVPRQNQQDYVARTFSPAFYQAVANSVATLPPRSQTFDPSTSSGPPSKEQGSSSAYADAGSSEQTTPLPTSAGTEAGSSMPPEVVAAVEELQRLSSLDTEQLKEVLSSRPALREAIKILVERQSGKTQVQPQTPAEISAPTT